MWGYRCHHVQPPHLSQQHISILIWVFLHKFRCWLGLLKLSNKNKNKTPVSTCTFVHVFLQVTFFKAFSPTFATLMLLCGEMISTEVQDCFKQIIWVGWGGK